MALFEPSNDPGRQRRRVAGARERIAAASGRAPRGVTEDAWRGSAVELEELRPTAEAAGLGVGRVAGEGPEYCAVLLRRTDAPSRPAAGGTVAGYYDRYWAQA